MGARTNSCIVVLGECEQAARQDRKIRGSNRDGCESGTLFSLGRFLTQCVLGRSADCGQWRAHLVRCVSHETALSLVCIADRSQLYKDLASGPFFGFNRPGAKPSQGMIDSFWLQGMQAGHKNTFDCIKAFSETDFKADLAKFDLPTLILHGDDDQVVPIAVGGLASAKLVKDNTLKVYPKAPHGLADTHKEQLNADLLAFLKA